VRTLVSLAIALAVTTMSAAFAVAQTTTPAPDRKADQPAATTTRNVSGTVRSASADTVVVAGREKGKDAEWTFAVEPTTNIRKGSKSITAGDLKPGDAAQVRFVERAGKAMASSILVRTPKKDAKK
jgi:hypothetical protein